MRYYLKAKHGRRVQHFDFHSPSHEQAKSDAVHLIVNYLRQRRGGSRQVWQVGIITMSDERGVFHELHVPPHLVVL
jgi:hypothetical protein